MRKRDWVGGAVLVGLFLLLPPLLHNQYFTGVFIVCAIDGIWAASWNFFSGLTGRENFGHALFIGGGAYTAAFLNGSFGLNPWFSIPGGIVVAVVLGLLIGFPTLRLKGPYFALATLASAAIMQQVAINLWQYTGGTEGIYGLDSLIGSSLGYYYFVLAVMLATVVVLSLISHSRWGTILRAIKGDETACQAAGINVTVYKIASLALSAALAGLGGVLFAHYQQAVTPDDFDVFLSISVIVMAYVGGIGSIWGAACGGILLNLMLELLRGMGEYRLWVYYLILMVVLFFMRSGVVAPLWRRLSGDRSA
jgi:branched-chain amino acid transport system permease protein